ncbi:MAG: helicase-associated domain-containing protein, partial [Planctomycetia bacterium]
QQNQLFKRDFERIAGSPILNATMLDTPEPIADAGLMTYALAESQGWLETGDDAPPSLETAWPDGFHDLLLRTTADFVAVDAWNELGADAPIGPWIGEAPSARFLVLFLLSLPDPSEAVDLTPLGDRLAAAHPPWNAVGELIGVLRSPDRRRVLCRRWVRAFVLGPLYQLGIVEIASAAAVVGLNDAEVEYYVRLTPLGRRFCGQPSAASEPPVFPMTLLAQPNHAVLVYRQGLTVDLLRQLVMFAEPKKIGAALEFEINADSVYHGLEVGMTSTRILSALEKYGGRALPSGLAESVRTWSQKRERVGLYQQATLLEFTTPEDLDEALQRGVVGVRISDRLLLAGGDAPPNLLPLKIIASRDYQLPPEQCVDVGADGVTLKIDSAKSDLMLDAELRRFAEPLPLRDAQGRRQYRITPDTLRTALEN